MAKSTIIQNLEKLYNDIGNKWVNQNSLVINYAKGAKLAVGGSVAMAVSNKKPHKIPGDLDFFTDNNEDALKFIQNITYWLSTRPNTHYTMQFNTKTAYTLPGVSHHVRISVPFWKPICVMTLMNPIRAFYYHGLRVQYFDDVVAAAKQASSIDDKERLPFNVEECSNIIRDRYIANGSYDVGTCHILCDSTNNPLEDINNNRVNVYINIDHVAATPPPPPSSAVRSRSTRVRAQEQLTPRDPYIGDMERTNPLNGRVWSTDSIT